MQELKEPRITIIAVTATKDEAMPDNPGIYLTASDTAELEPISLSNGIRPVTHTASSVYRPNTTSTELINAREELSLDF